MKKAVLFASVLFVLSVEGQVVYEDINNTGIYEFLDELANLKVIEINSVVKPYSRQYIAEKLKEAIERTGAQADKPASRQGSGLALNKRQKKELEFYWQDYQLDIRCEIPKSKYQNPNKFQNRHSGEQRNEATKIQNDSGDQKVPDTGYPIPDTGYQNHEPRTTKPGRECYIEYDHKLGFLFKKKPAFAVPLNPLAFQYKDRLFTLSVRPVGGFFYMMNENGSMYQRYWGASAFMYFGKYVGGYASLRDNYATELLVQPEYFTLGTGGVYKVNEGGRKGGDWSEMRGGISVSWKWGSIGLLKDFFIWGNNYHGSNILSGHAPSFPYIQLHLNPVKWFDFYYIHGWLVSKVVDSARSYYTDNGAYRIIYHNKYIAANIFTFTPWKRLNISFGNSIIYSGDINPAFLIPFLFYKSVDHSSYFANNAGSNAQMFLDISSRQIRHLHLFVTLFIDELTVNNILDKNKFNFTSWKFGFRESGFLLRDLALTAEYTITKPFTYQHYISTTTFASNHYNLGSYMRDNSEDLYVSVSYKALRGLTVQASYTLAQHGDDFQYRDNAGKHVQDANAFPFLKNKTWQNRQFAFMARYELVSGIYFWLQYLNTNRSGDLKFGPEIMHGQTNTLVAGVNVGF